MNITRINLTLLSGVLVSFAVIFMYLTGRSIERQVYLNPTDRNGGEDLGTFDMRIVVLLMGVILLLQGFRISTKLNQSVE